MGELIVGEPAAIFTVHEGEGGYDVHDIATCDTYVEVVGGDDNGRGVADYIDPSNTTAAAIWSATSPDRYSAKDGKSLGGKPGPHNFLIYWDADEWRELEDGTSITQVRVNGALLDCGSCASTQPHQVHADACGVTCSATGAKRSSGANRTTRAAPRVHDHRRHGAPHLHPDARPERTGAQVSFQQSAYNQPHRTWASTSAAGWLLRRSRTSASRRSDRTATVSAAETLIGFGWVTSLPDRALKVHLAFSSVRARVRPSCIAARPSRGALLLGLALSSSVVARILARSGSSSGAGRCRDRRHRIDRRILERGSATSTGGAPV